MLDLITGDCRSHWGFSDSRPFPLLSRRARSTENMHHHVNVSIAGSNDV